MVELLAAALHVWSFLLEVPCALLVFHLFLKMHLII